MSGLDFVFQFSSKGDGDVNEKVEELKKSIQSLQEELAKAVEAKEKLGKSLGKKASKGAKNIQSEIDRERKAFNTQKRNVEFLEKKRARGATLTKKQNDYIEKFYGKWFKLDKEKIKDLKDSDRLNLQNVQKTIEGQEKIEKNADKNHKNEIRRTKERMRMSGLARGALKLAGAVLGIASVASFAREQFKSEISSQMTGMFTNLPSNFLVGIGQASREFGGSPEAVQQAIGRLQRNLTLQRTDVGIASDLQRNLAMTGLVGGKGGLTREEVWTTDARELLSGIARSYQNLPENKRRQSKEYLANVLGDMSLVNMLTSGRYENLMQDYSKEAEHPATKELNEDVASIRATVEDIARSGIETTAQAIEDTKRAMKGENGLSGKGFGKYVIEHQAEIGQDWQNALDRKIFFPIFDWLSNNNEVKAGEDISNAVSNGGGKVEINNTYEDNSVTEVNSVEEANQSKEGRVSAANAVFSTGKRMAMGSSLQSTGV